MIDRNIGIFAALRASNEAYKKYRGTWGPIGVSFLLMLPAILPIVGYVAGLVLEFLYQSAYAMRYEQIKFLDEGKRPQTLIEAELAAEQRT